MGQPNCLELPIGSLMRDPYPMVGRDTSLEEVSKLISKENHAVMVDLGEGKKHIITRHDLIASV